MSEEKYNQEWFKNRALTSIKSITPHIWDYSDSLLLYLSSGTEQYESIQEEDSSYFNLVTKPERVYLKSIAKDIVAALPQKFEFIDLGPGTEHKEQFLFNEIKEQGKEFTYVPVDISTYYLELAEQHAESQGVEVRPIQSSFEELPELLGAPSVPRFVSIGLTFSNYQPQVILKLLKDIAGEGGYVFINSQMRDRIDMDALQEVYARDGATLANDKLRLIGLDPDADVSAREADDGFRIWGTIRNPSEEAEKLGMESGDKVLLFQSLRYTPQQLEDELKNFGSRHQLFDIGESFIAALINV